MEEMEKLDTLQADDIFTSPIKIKHILKENSISLKKRLGQHILFDGNVIRKIVESMNLNKGDKIIEIGPGIGNITKFYIDRVNYAYLIEIDKGLVRVIKSLLSAENMEVIHQDVLKTDFRNIVKEGKYILFSNLPYSIASQIVVKLIDNFYLFKEIYIMVPEILYKRMTIFNKSNFSRIGLLCNTFFNIEYLFKISRNSFFPVPDVNSVFIRLVPKDAPEVEYKNLETFKDFLKIIFKHRRKKISYSNKDIILYFNTDKVGLYEIFKELEIDTGIRVEEMPFQQVLKLYKKLFDFYYKYTENKINTIIQNT